MKKILSFFLTFTLCIFSIFPKNTSANSINNIVNIDMSIPEIIETAKLYDITTKINGNINKNDFVNCINKTYRDSLNYDYESQYLNNRALDAGIKKVKKTTTYTGTKDGNGVSFNYKLNIEAYVSVYSEASGYKKIVSVDPNDINSSYPSNLGIYNQYDSWSVIAPNGTYATISGEGLLRTSGARNRILPFEVKIYP